MGLTLIAITIVRVATGVLKELRLWGTLLGEWLPIHVILLLMLVVLVVIHGGGGAVPWSP